ncbi:hypothetical protein IT415_03850 [bacterium]|nr:hypothetical protein [bacterium]
MASYNNQYTPWDKSLIIRLGLLDIIHGRTQIIDFLHAERDHLSDDLLALERALQTWHTDQPVDVGESGTLYRFLQFTARRKGLHKDFVTHGTLRDRPITGNPGIAHQPQEIPLLSTATPHSGPRLPHSIVILPASRIRRLSLHSPTSPSITRNSIKQPAGYQSATQLYKRKQRHSCAILLGKALIFTLDKLMTIASPARLGS